jgi:hypothetical protein
MSRATVRAQVAQYISDGTIPDLNQILTSFPSVINFQTNALPGQMSRAVGVVFIEAEQEERMALGGAYSGKKRVDYSVVFQVFHHSLQTKSEDAMDDYDSTIDALKEWLRADHNFGDVTGQIVWQAAEPAITVNYGEPARTNGGATETWAGIRFTVTEIITA